jgi:putative FmdB family regulatory protein
MPLYEYECGACGHRFEVIRKFSDPPEEKCPKCGGAVHKMQSAPAFQFKGTGWYVTDYAKSGQADSKDGRKSDSKVDKVDTKETKKDGGTETPAKSDTTAASTSTSTSPTAATPGTSSTKTGDS